MQQSKFIIKKMDCPSEENLIRLQLDKIREIRSMEFDIPNRTLIVYHQNIQQEVFNALTELKLDTSMVGTEEVEDSIDLTQSNQMESRLLWSVLIINFSFFVLEIITGFLSGSMGLMADSLDMLADSFVYGLSLLVVGATILKKKRVATISGYFQMILAFLGFIEVMRRFSGYEQLPDFTSMIVVSFLALLANIACLYLLQKSKSKEAHLQASMIFTSNDVVINAGVIIAGILVYIFQSALPDLIIGSIVFLIVMRGALRILKLGK